jgi:uncharacterized protein (TIGR00295 family)
MSEKRTPPPPIPDRAQALKIMEKAGCDPKVIRHCKAVAKFAAIITERFKEQGVKVDGDLVQAGALLHDLGRSKSHSIDHAVVGASLARELGLDPKIIMIIERHIGAGIPADEAVILGLPKKDYIPKTIEEKIVTHADNMCNFKRHPVDVSIEKLEAKGQLSAAQRMRALHKELSDIAGMDLNDL